MANADKYWNIVANPMMPDWPRILFTDVALREYGDKTKMTLIWTPHDATDAEIAFFKAAIGQMGQGWSAGMTALAALLEELQQSP